MRADEQVRELPASGAGLREQLGDGRLQHILREQERWLERHALRAAARTLGALGAQVGVLVEKPARVALKNASEQIQQPGRRRALAALDHAQVRHRGRKLGIALDAAGRHLFEREAIAFAQRAKLGAEEVTLAKNDGHGGAPAGEYLVKLTV